MLDCCKEEVDEVVDVEEDDLARARYAPNAATMMTITTTTAITTVEIATLFFSTGLICSRQGFQDGHYFNQSPEILT